MGILSWLFKSKKKQTTIEENARRMKKKYPLNEEGYFGKRGKGRARGKRGKKEKVRVIESNNQYRTARDFYLKIGRGGKEGPLPNGHGVERRLSDDSSIIYREKTGTENSPAVHIHINKESKIQNQKIHFERRKKK